MLKELLKKRKEFMMKHRRQPQFVEIPKQKRIQLEQELRQHCKGLGLKDEPDWAQDIIGSNKIFGMNIIELCIVDDNSCLLLDSND